MFAPSEFAPNFQSALTAFAPKYAYYLEYFSFFKREKNYLEYFSFFKRGKSVTTLVIGGGELEKSTERTRWVRTRLGAKPASFNRSEIDTYATLRATILGVGARSSLVTMYSDGL